MDQPVKDEITFERDMGLLLRHRKWGFNVPAVDIDALLAQPAGSTVIDTRKQESAHTSKGIPNPRSTRCHTGKTSA